MELQSKQSNKRCPRVLQDKFRNMIADEYLVNWMVDNLPAATKYSQTGAGNNMSFTFWETTEFLLHCCPFYQAPIIRT